MDEEDSKRMGNERHGGHDEQLAQSVSRLAYEIAHLNKHWKEFMNALDTITQAVTANTAASTALTESVNLAITKLGTPANEAEIIALAGVVDANTANAAALKTALDAALNPPQP
jgi:hypothetical protein